MYLLPGLSSFYFWKYLIKIYCWPLKGIIETQEDTKKEDFLSKIADEVEHLGDMMNVFKGMELFNYLRVGAQT